MYKKETKQRIFALGAVLAANVICTALALCVPIETTGMKICGSYFAILLTALCAWKFPTRFYCAAMGFVFFASTLGSCVNLYRHLGFYDLFVHYLSGVLLAECGFLLCGALLRRCRMQENHLVKHLFAFFFSCSCAGLWEIYEYTADLLIHAQMQGSKSNIMGDIICGVLGALTYFAVNLLFANLKKRKVTAAVN